MGISLIEGEGFTAEDKQGALNVVIVNQTMARRFWLNEKAVGKRLKGGKRILPVYGGRSKGW